jgi:hypothetical protein
MPHVSTAIRWYLFFGISYLILSFILPANNAVMHNYNLSAPQYHVLIGILLLPYIGIWFAAFYGYAKLQEYADMIKDSKEGPSFKCIADGFQWLAWGLPIPALIALFLNAIANSHSGFLPASLIISTYVSLIFPIVAFTLISRGTRGLTDLAKSRINSIEARYILIIFLVLGVAFCFFTFQHLDLHSLGSTDNPYYLPGWLLIITVIVPYLFAWFSGLLAAFEMVLYGRKVSGVFYRQAMQLLAGGMTCVIASLIFVQYVRTVIPRSAHLSLNSTLLLVNIFFIVMAVGFVLMILAATKLKRIEEI